MRNSQVVHFASHDVVTKPRARVVVAHSSFDKLRMRPLPNLMLRLSKYEVGVGELVALLTFHELNAMPGPGRTGG